MKALVLGPIGSGRDGALGSKNETLGFRISQSLRVRSFSLLTAPSTAAHD